MIRVGVIGYGRWGPNLARCIAADRAFALAAICDTSAERLLAASLDYSNVRLESDPDLLVNDPSIDAVLLATPAITHYRSARAALRAGKHVLVEKPIALASDHVLRLMEEADRQRLVLMVDHTYVFSPPVRTIRRAVKAGSLGAIRSLESVRVNQGGGSHDVNVLWDLAYHDLSIIDYIFAKAPFAISAVGRDCKPGAPESCADVTLYFRNDFIARIHVNRAGPAKVRRMLIAGSRNSLLFDDLEPKAKIRIYDNAADHKCNPMFADEISSLSFADMEPLRAVVDHFASCVLNGTRPLSGGDAAFRTALLLEVAGRSMTDAGPILSLSVDEPA
jgi:predicted dehydrogenase